MNEKSNEKNSPQEFSNDQIARRKLLTIAAYVPPAILGVMITGSKSAEALPPDPVGTQNCRSGTIVISAGGTACCPCVPDDPRYNIDRCNRQRCRLGNCAACQLLTFTSRRRCRRELRRTPCACTCVKSPPGSGFWVMTGC